MGVPKKLFGVSVVFTEAVFLFMAHAVFWVEGRQKESAEFDFFRDPESFRKTLFSLPGYLNEKNGFSQISKILLLFFNICTSCIKIYKFCVFYPLPLFQCTDGSSRQAAEEAVCQGPPRSDLHSDDADVGHIRRLLCDASVRILPHRRKYVLRRSGRLHRFLQQGKTFEFR